MAPRTKDEFAENTDPSVTKDLDERSSSDSDGKLNKEQQHSEQPSSTWPEVTGGRTTRIFKSWTFCYMKALLKKGKQQSLGGAHLIQEDLYDVPDTMKAKRLVELFSEIYKQEDGRLLRVLWRLAAPTFVPAGFVQLAYMAARITLPLAMRELLIVLEEHPNEAVVRAGLPYAATIFLATIVAAFAQHRQIHLATKSGIIMRAALISVIYEHSLKLSAGGKSGLTTGEVTNLVATDTQKLFEVMLEGHLIWSCPLFIVIVTGLLWYVMGPVMVIGVVVLMAFVPVVQSIVQRMLKIRKKRAILTDYRINIITSMLQGIRVTKLNHYESKVLERVAETRGKEMKLLRSELFMWGWTLVSAVSSPLLATAASFSCYALIREDNIITPSSAFTVLLLYSILRFPINLGKSEYAAINVC
jgi:ABC-type multidrug transport system fused ATPase/permease subunit